MRKGVCSIVCGKYYYSTKLWWHVVVLVEGGVRRSLSQRVVCRIIGTNGKSWEASNCIVIRACDAFDLNPNRGLHDDGSFVGISVMRLVVSRET